jgi:hypothetical protein
MYAMFMGGKEEFNEHCHLRSNVEATCYGSAYVQTTRAWRNTYIGGESREGEFLTLSSFQR